MLVLSLPSTLPPDGSGGLEVLELVVVAFPWAIPPLPLPDKGQLGEGIGENLMSGKGGWLKNPEEGAEAAA